MPMFRHYSGEKMTSKDTISEFVELMTIETLNITKAYIKKFTDDPDKIRLLAAKLVSSITAELLISSMYSYDKKASKKIQLSQVETNFASMKRTIQLQVAEGFNKAIYSYSGQDLDYYCAVKLAAEPKENKVLQ
jgi:hypothetical protein